MPTEPRPTGCVAVLLGSAATAVFLGAGIAAADDDSAGSGVARDASSSSSAESGVSRAAANAGPRADASRDDPRKARVVSLSTTPTATARVDRSPRATRLEASSEAVVTPSRRPARPVLTSAPTPPELKPRPAAASGRALQDPGQAAAQFTRQLVGLTSDVGAVGASLVNNIAAQIAHGFGPGPVGAGPREVALAIADAAAEVSRGFTGTPETAVSTGPFPVTYGVFDVLAYLTPAAVPPGANEPTITVTEQRPLPVILVNGTGMTAAFNWSVGAPVLANAGYKVYTFNYGNRSGIPNFPVQGVDDITVSAQQLSQEIDRVLAETGAPQVVLVGYSQGGGILPAYYINVLGGGPKVSQVIGLAPSNHGTDLDYLAYATLLPVIGPLLMFVVGTVAPGALQQTITSPFQEVVYGHGDTRPGVLYTNIVSINDEVVTPYTQQFLSGPNVSNILVQSRQPSFVGGHGSVLVSPTVWTLVLEALAANPAANPLRFPAATTVSVAA
ncbi:hypothetical protein A5757_13020 [Mycobacterium sp. 852013-51886_SCH5428379]|uniref:esterase/lipase family protein n=1 Tax=Mycobacterium sp. 852013-51886_SCH5428379 TaxID=1834111 RepID=UPI0008020BC4|nr:alpha/beta fold hydrolase [Mycobacterium sp. 852013-51886_SCH5428379]OBB59980.1 hypothetical protein A5757_13020 [Mycobacterium sp. 852013-51886_SCH5428379]